MTMVAMAIAVPAPAAPQAAPAAPTKASPPKATPAKAAPAPTPPPPPGPHPKPIGSPSAWFPADAYPPEARNAGQEGRTVFLVKIDAQGRILECDIVQSSGSAQLDNTTCDLVVTHGRFQPAKGEDGKPVPGMWQSAMRWQLVAGAPTVDDSDSQ